MQRSIEVYDPYEDAAIRWPGWTIAFTDLAGITAVFSAERETFLLDAARWSGREDEAVAQAVAHLDLAHHLSSGGLSAEQQSQGRWLARVRLDKADEQV